MLLAISIIIAILSYLYFYVSKCWNYWDARDVPHIKLSIFGNLFNKKPEEEQHREQYNKFLNKRYYGIYQLLRPVLVIRDPELIKEITVKSFEAFGDRRAVLPKEADPVWAKSFLQLRIEDGWHDMRSSISPAFTSAKLKAMYGLIEKCAEQCVNYYQNQEGIITVEARDVFSKYTVDVIGTTMFGVACNSYEEPENDFYSMATQTLEFTGLKGFTFLGYAFIPRIMQLLDFRIYEKKLVAFFSGLINESLRLRRENKLIRHDFIHLLMEAQKGKLNYGSEKEIDSGYSAIDESDYIRNRKTKGEVTDDDVTAIGLGFFFGGYHTTPRGLSFIIYELALNPDVQEKLFKEIASVPKEANGKVTYETLLGMKYLDMVISETMRKWPAGYNLDRVCRVPYNLEPKNGEEKSLLIDKGTQCRFSFFAIHRDPQYYPDPEKFDPERFNDENKRNIKSFTFFPFGLGPRSCLASRFVLLVFKIILVEVVRKFEIVPVEKTLMPLNFKSKGFLSYYPTGGFWFGLKKRTKAI